MKKTATFLVAIAMSVPSLLAQEGEPRQDEEQQQEQQQEQRQMEQQDRQPEQPQMRSQRNPGEVRTLFDPHSGSGGYGALSIGYTQIAGRDAILMGGRGEWVVGHGFGLGVAGYGFVNDPIYNAADNLNYALAGGYGGLVMEPIIMGWFPVHIALPILIGAGGVANTSYSTDWYDPYYYPDGQFQDAAVFFVADAGVELEFNLVKFLRLSLFGTYRYTTDIIMDDAAEDALRGWNYGITFKFGSF